MEFDPLHSIAPTAFRLDAWLASSLLQKAIRRSEAAIATSAAMAYFRARGSAIWRRLQVIAAEDVGVGSLEAVTAAAYSTDPAWRAQVGGDVSAIIYITRLLSIAPKDRSAEHLIRLCRDYSGFDETRELVATASMSSLLQLAADPNTSLVLRASAAWYSSGLNVGRERRMNGGDLQGVLHALGDAGLPDALVAATAAMARRTREPISLMPAVIWLEAQKGPEPVVSLESLRESSQLGAVPAYALDKFTANGKAAIRRFVHENRALRAVLEAQVPEFRAYEAAAMAVFYAEGGQVAVRYDWRGSRALEALGTHEDLAGVGVARDGVDDLIEVVRANLDHLDEIRARLYRSQRSS